METVDRIYENPDNEIRNRVLEAESPVIADFVKYKVTYLTDVYKRQTWNCHYAVQCSDVKEFIQRQNEAGASNISCLLRWISACCVSNNEARL